MRIFGSTTLIPAMFFALVETAHFGWNLTPGSDAELFADGLAILIYAIGLRRE